MLAGHGSVVSRDEPRGQPDDDPDGEFTLHDALAATGEDAGTAAGRRIDWDQALQTMDATRKAHGLTQAEVAARLGVCRTWVSKVESCEVGLDLLGVIRLCRVYGLKTATAVEVMEKA